MSLNWINVEEYSFNSFLLMERFQLRILLKAAKHEEKLFEQLRIALWANPAVRWYFLHKCPECRAIVENLGEKSTEKISHQEVRAAELSEIFRVVKSGGWVLDCPGEQRRKREPDKELLRYGFEEFHYVSSLGGDVYRYRKQIFKAD